MKVVHDGLGNKTPEWPKLGLLNNKLHIQFRDNCPWYCLSDGSNPDGHHDEVEPVQLGFKATLEQS